MAQGCMKTKVRLPAGAKQKQKHAQKIPGLKKGSRTIAPKKTRHIEAVKIKKTLEKRIKSNIEREVVLKASSMEAKSFTVFQSGASGETSKKKS